MAGESDPMIDVIQLRPKLEALNYVKLQPPAIIVTCPSIAWTLVSLE